MDKVTILEIKTERLSGEPAANAKKELALLLKALASVADMPAELARLRTTLSEINRRLWEVEDALRQKEADQTFDSQFIQLARSVYLNNDERSRIKRAINIALHSDIIEEKQYAAY